MEAARPSQFAVLSQREVVVRLPRPLPSKYLARSPQAIKGISLVLIRFWLEVFYNLCFFPELMSGEIEAGAGARAGLDFHSYYNFRVYNLTRLLNLIFLWKTVGLSHGGYGRRRPSGGGARNPWTLVIQKSRWNVDWVSNLF